MELTLSAQTQAFIYSCALGAMLSVVYTAMGILKIMSPPGKRLLFFMDLIFMLVCTFATFLFSVAMTWGSIRYYVVFGELVGFFLFYLTVGELILKCSKVITDFILKLYLFITSPFRKLFKRLFAFALRLAAKLKIKFIKSRKKPKKKFLKKPAAVKQTEKPRIMARQKDRL